MRKTTKMIVASLMAAVTVAPTFASIVPMTASAGQVLGETSFDHKALPWHTCESSPAKQTFSIDDGTFHCKILTADGADGAKWDLQFRHRNLNFKAGHTYQVSFEAKAKRQGMQLCSKIGNTKGDKEYFDLQPSGFVMGPAMGGQWGKAVELTTSFQKFSGTFTPTEDLEGVEWAFHYAGAKLKPDQGGNAIDGDEIWFDNMSIICETCGDGPWSPDKCDADPTKSYGATNRDYSASKNPDMKKGDTLINYISVNQLGYYTDLQKIATLGDNKGDILYGASSIDLTKGQTYDWELIDAKSGSKVASGTSGAAFYDADSHDTVAKIDFSDFKTKGTYYLKIAGKDWRSFEFQIADDIYAQKYGKTHSLLTNSLNYFYQNRSGCTIDANYITSREDQSNLAHKGGHQTDTATIQKEWHNEYLSESEATSTYACGTLTANGGWYDAGDHGKYVVNGGIAVWTLQNMYERSLFAKDDSVKKKFADGSKSIVVPESSNKIPDLLDECAYELDFIQQMKVSDKDTVWSKSAPGLYYHKLHDHKWTGLATRPWDYASEWKTTRIVKPPTFAATLNYAACAGQAARLWADIDSKKAEEYLTTAIDAYNAYKALWYEADLTEVTHPDLKCKCPAEEINEKSLYAPMWQAKGGGPYGDNEVRDDAYWAACEIFVSAKEMGKDSDADTFMKELSSYKLSDDNSAFKVTTRITGGENKDGSLTTFNWGNTASAGSLTLALHRDLLSDAQAKTLNDSILAAAKTYIDTEKKQGYGIPYLYDGPGYNDPNNLDPSIIIKGYEWGSNSMVINNLIVLAYAYDLTGEKQYMNGVISGMDYLLGCNPLSFSYVTGYGSYYEQNPHHRYWSHELDKTLPEAPDGVLSGGPNAGLQDPYVRALGFVSGEGDNPSQRCFVDSIEAWSTNEVTINWNAPLAWIAEFLEDKDAKYDFAGAGSQPGPGPEGDFDWGNVDLENKVDVSDAVLLAKYNAGIDDVVIDDQGLLNADVNESGKPDAEDLTIILQYIVGLVEYGAKKPA